MAVASVITNNTMTTLINLACFYNYFYQLSEVRMYSASVT